MEDAGRGGIDFGLVIVIPLDRIALDVHTKPTSRNDGEKWGTLFRFTLPHFLLFVLTSSSSRKKLLARVGFGRADAGALVEAFSALRCALGDVVEVGGVLGGVCQFAIHLAEFGDASAGVGAAGVPDSREGGRGQTVPADGIPVAFEINRSATEIGGHVGISALGSDDAFHAILICGPGLVGAEVAASTAGVVNLACEIAAGIAVKVSASDGDDVGRRAGINVDSEASVTGCGEKDDALGGEIFVPGEFLTDFGVAPAHADPAASCAGDELGGVLHGGESRVGVDLNRFDQVELGLRGHSVRPLDVEGLLGFPLRINRGLAGSGPGNGEIGGGNAVVGGEGGEIGGCGGIVAGVDDGEGSPRAPAAGGHGGASGDGAASGSGDEFVDARDRAGSFNAGWWLRRGLVGVDEEIVCVMGAGGGGGGF